MKSRQGFTIIELMIATVVFSMVMLMALAGIMQITRLYFKGITNSRTQETARNVVDEIGESLRFSNETYTLQPIPPTPLAQAIVSGEVLFNATDDTNYFCLGSKRYTYAIDRQLKENPSGPKEKRHVLWVDQPDTGCAAGPADLTLENPSVNKGGRELLSENMRLAVFDITKVAKNDDAYVINVTIAYGNDSTQSGGALVFDGGVRTCQSANAKAIGEYCAVSNISVTVERRL